MSTSPKKIKKMKTPNPKRGVDLTLSMCLPGKTATIRRKAPVRKPAPNDPDCMVHFRFLEASDTVLVMGVRLFEKKGYSLVEVLLRDGEIGWIHSKFLHFYPEA